MAEPLRRSELEWLSKAHQPGLQSFWRKADQGQLQYSLKQPQNAQSRRETDIKRPCHGMGRLEMVINSNEVVQVRRNGSHHQRGKDEVLPEWKNGCGM